MQNKFTATWVIAAFLFGVMIVFSLFPSQEVSAEYDDSLSSTEFAIHNDELAATDFTMSDKGTLKN